VTKGIGLRLAAPNVPRHPDLVVDSKRHIGHYALSNGVGVPGVIQYADIPPIRASS
jgi:hypothetical protein